MSSKPWDCRGAWNIRWWQREGRIASICRFVLLDVDNLFVRNLWELDYRNTLGQRVVATLESAMSRIQPEPNLIFFWQPFYSFFCFTTGLIGSRSATSDVISVLPVVLFPSVCIMSMYTPFQGVCMRLSIRNSAFVSWILELSRVHGVYTTNVLVLFRFRASSATGPRLCLEHWGHRAYHLKWILTPCSMLWRYRRTQLKWWTYVL